MSVASAPSPTRTTLRVATELRLARSPSHVKTRCTGSSSLAPSGDVEHRAVGHEGRVERDARRRRRAPSSSHELGLDPRRRRLRERSRSECTARPVAVHASGSWPRRRPVDEHDAMRFEAGERAERRRRRRRCASTRVLAAPRPAAAPPSAGAQVGVLPLLDAPVRQAQRPKRADRLAAQPRARRAARQLARSNASRTARRQRLLGLGLHHLHASSDAPSPLCLASSHSRSSSRRLALVLGIARLLELQRQLLAARLLDPAVGQHVHPVGHDVVQAAAGSG